MTKVSTIVMTAMTLMLSVVVAAMSLIVFLAVVIHGAHANTIKGLFTDNIGSVYKTAHFYDDTYTWYEIDSKMPDYIGGYQDINFESELLTLSAAFNNGWNITFGCCIATGVLNSGIVYGLGVTRP